MSQKIKTSVEIDGSLSASQIANATTDTDKFLVSDGGTIKYRTGAELATDLGISAGTTSKVQHQVKAGVAINKGQAVYVTSADGTNMIVGLASNASEATSSKTMGLLNATVVANGFADVITEGLLDGLDTSTATVGNPVWLGTGGNLIYGLANKPYAPNHLVFIGIVTRVNANNGEIFVKVQNGFELDEIHDVDLKTTAKINGHLLGYNGSLWVNKTIAEWLGYTPYNASNPAGYISSYTETDTLASVTARGATTGTSITVGGVFTTKGTNPYIQWQNSAGTRLGYIQHATNLVMSSDTGNIEFTPNSNLAKVIGNFEITGTLSASGYNKTNWDTAFGWGNHASAGYLTSVTNISGYSRSLNGFANQTEYTILDGPANGPVWKVRYDSATANRYIDFGFKDGNGVYYTGLKIYNGDTPTWQGSTLLHAGNYSSYAVPTSRTITINGTSYDLSANRSWTVTASETDTLQTVTSRGNTTTTSITANSIIIPSFETATNVLSFRSGIPDGTNVGIRAKATVTANRDGLELLGYNGIDFSINNGNTVAGKFNNYGQFLVNAASSGYGANLYGYNLGMRGNTSQAYVSIALSNQTLDTQGLIVGIDTGYARFHVRDSKPISFANGDVERMTLDTSANLIANGSVRSPIFYDSNDTSFYTDPASTSNLNKLRITSAGNSAGGNILMGPAGEGVGKWSYLTGTHYNATSQSKGVSIIGLYASASENAISIGGNIYEANPATEIRFYTHNAITHGTGGSVRMVINSAGNVEANVDMRAPIFYDSNDTSYYVDPAGNGTRAAVFNGNLWITPKPESYGEGVTFNMPNQATWGGLRWYRNGPAGGYAGNWAFGYFGNESNNDVGFHNGTNGWRLDHSFNMTSIGSVRSTIFYDSSDTGYYWNPATDTSHRFQTPSGYIDIGPKNGAHAHIYTDRDSFYFNKEALINGGTVWHSFNDGAGSGLDADLIDGIGSHRIVYGSGASKISSHPNANEWRDSGFYENDGGGSNWPSGTWYNSINVRHSNQGNYHGFQVAMSYYDNNLWFRSYQGAGTFQGWQRAAVARGEGTNYIDHARYVYNNGAYSGSGWVEPSDLGVRYALNSTNAGNADTVDGFHGDTFFRNLGFGSGYPSWNANTIDESRSGFTYANGAPHSGCIAHFGASGYGIQLNGNYGGDTFAMRSRNGDNGTWRPWKTLYTDYNMDAPNKSGTSYYQTNTWMQFNGTYGLYWPSAYGAHFHPNDATSYTQFRLQGSKNGYGGIYDSYSGVNGIMYDGAGNGGVYREANGRWFWYHHIGNNCTGISTSATSSSYRAYIGGSLYAEGDIVAYSDRRKKENIVTVDRALDKVNKLRGVYYNRIDDDAKKRQVGVIAQEIQEILPEVVTYAEDVDEYGVSYGNITGLLIEAIKEQQTQIEELKELVKTLINK